MTDFIDAISTAERFDSDRVAGYSATEISHIEKLYDIVVGGQLHSFLSQIGRCAGCSIGDDQVVFYSKRTIRQQFAYQRVKRAKLRQITQPNNYKDGYLIIGTVSYSQFLFLNTVGSESDIVYRFYGDNNEYKSTDKTLLETITEMATKTPVAHTGQPMSYQGELIV